MQLISYSDFLSEIDKFYNDDTFNDKVMCLNHPGTPDEFDINQKELYYIIPGNCHDYINEDIIYDILITHDLFKKYLESGEISEEVLRLRSNAMYGHATRLIIRCMGDTTIQSYYNYKGQDDNTFIYNILLKPWTTAERKLSISPFEIPNVQISDIWSGKRNDDKIEDTYTNIEYISFVDLKNRIKNLYNIEI